MKTMSTTEYTIQYWLDEDAREEGLSEILFEAYTNKQEAIDVAEKVFKLEGYACVEAISDDEDEGDYGVVAHFSNASKTAAIIAVA
jgi:hypothetical protein